MARAFRGGLGPDFKAHELVEEARTSLKFSHVATTTLGGASPPTGGYWLKAPSPSATITEAPLVPPLAITAKTYELIAGVLRIEGLVHSSDRRLVQVEDLSMDIGRDRKSPSTFTLYLLAGGFSKVESATTFSNNTDLTVVLRFDGARIKLWVNDTLEIDEAFTSKPSDQELTAHTPAVAASTEVFYWNGWLWLGSDSENDWPNVDTINVTRLDPNGDAESSDYGDDVACSTADGTYTNWQLDGSDLIDEATHNCQPGGDNGQELSDMETHSPSGTLLGIVTRARGQPNLDGKTVDTWTRISDGTSNQETQNANLDDTDIWETRVHTFDTAPDTGAWTQGDVDALKVGVRTVDTNGANDRWAAVCAELFAVTLSAPPSAVGDRRRLLGQVV